MFKITSTREIAWPEFSLRKGENVFTSRKAVPQELWEKLDRFRTLKLLDFEGKAEAGDDTGPKLETLSQKQLYALSKAELVELAKSAGVIGIAEGVSKAQLIGELEKRLSPGAIAAPPPPEGEKPAGGPDLVGGGDGDKVVVSNRRGGRGAPLVPSSES